MHESFYDVKPGDNVRLLSDEGEVLLEGRVTRKVLGGDNKQGTSFHQLEVTDEFKRA